MNALKVEAGIYLVGGLAVVLALWYVKNKVENAAGDALSAVSDAAGDVYDSVASAAGQAYDSVSYAAATAVKATGSAAGVVGSSFGTGVSSIAFGIGDTIGVPRTNATKCQKDIAAGDGWAAFSSCPFGDYADAFLR